MPGASVVPSSVLVSLHDKDPTLLSWGPPHVHENAMTDRILFRTVKVAERARWFFTGHAHVTFLDPIQSATRRRETARANQLLALHYLEAQEASATTVERQVGFTVAHMAHFPPPPNMFFCGTDDPADPVLQSGARLRLKLMTTSWIGPQTLTRPCPWRLSCIWMELPHPRCAATDHLLSAIIYLIFMSIL